MPGANPNKDVYPRLRAGARALREAAAHIPCAACSDRVDALAGAVERIAEQYEPPRPVVPHA